ncbi:ABC transporter ATP-binding protein [uncultured Methylobacterium sp.]|uniref:ABC transporter ATP-binding protein n=1 Tax=uncultured Methylobacterium sp. TaxID=157278 RepID=UPI0035C9786A
MSALLQARRFAAPAASSAFERMTRPAADAAPAVEVLSAEKVFPDGTRALAPIDLTVREGEFLSLIGPSGCGKSTLLSLVANLNEPSDGRLLWWRGGFDRVGAAGRGMSVVFQDATLMPWLRIAGNVRLPLDLAGVSRADAAPRVQAALDLVGLGRQGRQYPGQLSGGMRMRAAIARGLVTEPNLLLMDEPFGALDEFTRNRLDADLVDLWWRRSLTVLFVTHSIYEAVFLSTRIVVMAARPGRIFSQITIDEPHPRGDAFRRSPRFAESCKQLSTILTEASLASDPTTAAAVR